jgi:uncharacterized protein (TIGR00369 family)
VAEVESKKTIAEGAVAGPTGLRLAVRADHACFGCGADNPIGLRLSFAAGESGVAADFTPAPEHQGFEGVVHGGIISTVLDEAMAWATAAEGIWTVTGEMRVKFRHPLRIDEPTRVSARVTGRKGRIVHVAADLILASGDTRIASATGTFFEVAAEVADTWQARYLGTETVPSRSGDS